jgi:phosphoribosylanthranilate isomerase
MTFDVLPAIDVAGGRLARLTRSGPVPVEAFGGNALAAAHAFVDAGARRIHVVDMDRALGAGEDAGSVERIAALGVPVQASGGIVTEDDARRMLDAGADRVVISSRALADRAAFERLVDALGGSVVAGLELDGARIRPRGADDVDLDVVETAAWLAGTPTPRYLATDLGRLGQPAGPDLVHIRWLAERLRKPLLAAGGVSTVEDIRSLASVGAPLEGVVVGSALYGVVSLSELLEAAEG